MNPVSLGASRKSRATSYLQKLLKEINHLTNRFERYLLERYEVRHDKKSRVLVMWRLQDLEDGNRVIPWICARLGL